MKFWVKIVVALSVVVVIAFGVWAFVFKEKDEVQAYNRTCEIIEYKESLGVTERLVELKGINYIGSDKANVITDSTDIQKDILRVRNIIFSDNAINTYDDGGNITCTFDSYLTIERVTQDIILKLLPFIKNVNNADTQTKTLKKIASTYAKDYKLLKDNLDILIDCQTSIEGNNTEMEVLQNNYAYVRLVYRNCLKDSAELINTMFEIIKCKFGQINYDTEFALMDSFSRSLYISTSVIKDELESYRAHDLHLVVDKIDKYRKDINIFSTEYSEYNFLTNYNYICNNYSSEFDKVLQKQNIEKKEIANGKEPSDINMNVYKNSRLKCILKILGY